MNTKEIIKYLNKRLGTLEARATKNQKSYQFLKEDFEALQKKYRKHIKDLHFKGKE